MDFFSLSTFSRPSAKATMNRGFSQLFILPPQTSHSASAAPDTTPNPAPEKSTKRISQKQNLKHFFRRLLPSNASDLKADSILLPPTSEELGQRSWADLISASTTTPSLATPPPPTKAKPHSSRSISSIQTTPSTGSKSITLRKQRSQSTVVVRPPNPPYPSFKRDSIFNSKSGGKTGTNTPISRPDSKFSSISSLPSLQSLALPSHSHSTTNTTTSPASTLTITVTSLRQLQSCLRRIQRGLKQQEYLTSHLSNNLVFLFGRKEKQIGLLRRLRFDEKQILVNAVFRVKENAGRAFLRKAVFLQRSSELCLKIGEILARGKEDVEGEIEVEDGVIDLLNLVGEDLRTQRELDRGLKAAVLSACGEKRWGGSENERIMVGRFIVFIEGRLEVLEGCYARVEKAVERMNDVIRA